MVYFFVSWDKVPADRTVEKPLQEDLYPTLSFDFITI
jgi:hypothetical protein